MTRADADPATAVRLGTAAAAADSALQRLIIVAVPIWLLSALAVALAPGSGWPLLVLGGCLSVVAVAYALFIWKRRTPVLLVPMLVTGLLLALTSPPSEDLSGGSVVALWASLSALCLGALLPRRSSVAGALMGGTFPLAMARLHQGVLGTQGQSWRWVEVATFAVFAGLYTAVVGGVLRRMADQSDEVADFSARARAVAAREQAGQEELRRVARLLHDTVVNTLCAIHRWSAAGVAAVRARCQADLAFLRSVEGGVPTDPARLLDSARTRSRLLGLSLEVAVGSLGPPLDPVRAAAIEGACWEALNNAARHSGVAAARLEWDWDGTVGRLAVSDSGKGFQATGGWTGGAAESVAARATEAGVTANVVSAPGRGTTVTLAWAGPAIVAGLPADATAGADIRGELDGAMALTVLRISAVVGSIGLLSTVMQPAELPRWGSLGALAIIAGVALVAARIRAGLSVPRIPRLLYPLLIVAATVLPAIGRGNVGGIWWWGPPASLGVAIPLFLLDRRRWVVAMSVLGCVVGIVLGASLIGPAPGSQRPDQVSILLIDLGGVAALVAYRRRLTEAWVAGRRAQDRMQGELAEAARAAEQTRIRTRQLALARQVAEPLLVGIGDGSLDPTDPAVRERCGKVERVLRALSAVPAVPEGGMGALLVDTIIAAPERDVDLTLSLGPEAVMPPGPCVPGLARMLSGVLDGCPAGGSAQLTFLRTGDTARMLLLADQPEEQGGYVDIPDSPDGFAEWSFEHVDGQVLCEAAWSLQGSGTK